MKRAFLGTRWACAAGGHSMGNTGPESRVRPAGSVVGGARLRRAGADDGEGRA
jgi:hypothetical protein